MYCKNCGKEVKSEYKFCTRCGSPLSETFSTSNNNQSPINDKEFYVVVEKPTSIYAIVGLIFSILGIFTNGILTIIGLILCIIGKNECEREEKEGLNIAWAGIIISVIVLIIAVISIVLFIL